MGGRFSNKLPNAQTLESCDVCRRRDLNLTLLQERAHSVAEKFWVKYLRWLELQGVCPEDTDNLSDNRLAADVTTGLAGMGLLRWEKDGESVRPVMTVTNLTREEFLAHCRWYFEFATYAVLDDRGWHEEGRMGWWGQSSAPPEQEQAWKRSFLDAFLAQEDPETLLVIVDCHI